MSTQPKGLAGVLQEMMYGPGYKPPLTLRAKALGWTLLPWMINALLLALIIVAWMVGADS